jgi:hypothetical protein
MIGQQGKYLPKQMVHPVRPPMTVNSTAEEQQWRALGYEPIKTPEYREYPKTLVHLDYAPAKMVSPERHGPPVSADCHMAATARLASYTPAVWEPERNPPVIAKNPEEEAKYVALGYLVPGTGDAAAFAAAFAATPCTQREIILYPKWITPPQGEAVLVKSEAEEHALLARWSENERKRA